MFYQGALYHHHLPAGELEEVLWFMVSKGHWVVGMNGCHHDAGHQGQQWTLCLLNDQFWWPSMATQMQRVISSCKRCIQHEGIHVRAPIWLIIVTTPLELLHVDFTSIETMMELDRPPNMVNLLVFCDHFSKHVMASMTPNQTAKTVTKFQWQGYISIFGAPAKLLHDWGANFESNIIRELCELMGIQKVRALPYHAQTNGQVEWAHQMLMCMIGKLSKDQKVDWLKHLSKLVHAYNSMRSAITRYSPHYFMFRCQLHLPVDFYFPWSGVHRNTNVSTTTLLSCVKDCGRLSKRLRCSPYQRQRGRSGTTIGKLMQFYWNQMTWSCLKLMSTWGGEKWRIGGRRNCTKWSTKLWKASLPTLWKASGPDAHEFSTKIDFFSLLWQRGLISVWLCRPSMPGAPPPP